MNNPKLTNGLLTAVLSLNFIIFLGWAVSSGHRHHHHRSYAMEWHNRAGRHHHNHYFAYGRGERNFGNYGGFHRGGGFRHHHKSDNFDRE